MADSKTLRGRASSRWGNAGLSALAVLLTLTGCLLSPPTRDPSVVGVITSAENTTGVWEITLESGTSIRIDFDETTTLPDSRGGAEPGTLLFYGDDGEDEAWYFSLTPFDQEPACYWFAAEASDDGTHIVFENGLRLPKAADFDGQGWPQDGRYDFEVSGGDVAPFCMNEAGEVTEYRP